MKAFSWHVSTDCPPKEAESSWAHEVPHHLIPNQKFQLLMHCCQRLCPQLKQKLVEAIQDNLEAKQIVSNELPLELMIIADTHQEEESKVDHIYPQTQASKNSKCQACKAESNHTR